MFTLVHTDDYAHMKIFLLYKRNKSFFYIYDCLQPGDVMCIVASLQYNTHSNEHECLAQTGLKWGTQLAQCKVYKKFLVNQILLPLFIIIKIILLLKVIPGKNKVCYCKSCKKTKTKHSQCICEGKYGDWLFGKKRKPSPFHLACLKK